MARATMEVAPRSWHLSFLIMTLVPSLKTGGLWMRLMMRYKTEQPATVQIGVWGRHLIRGSLNLV